MWWRPTAHVLEEFTPDQHLQSTEENVLKSLAAKRSVIPLVRTPPYRRLLFRQLLSVQCSAAFLAPRARRDEV